MERNTSTGLTNSGNNVPEQKPAPAAAEAEGFKGPVRQVMQACYKAHYSRGAVIQGKLETGYSFSSKNWIFTFDEKGAKTHAQLFASDGSHSKKFDDEGREIESIHHKDGKLVQASVQTYDERGNLLETVVRHADGSLYYRVLNTYNAKGRLLEHLHLMGKDEQILQKTIYTYDEKGNNLSAITYNGEGVITRQYLTKYDDRGRRTEWLNESLEGKIPYYQRQTYKYNEHGDCIEMNYYNPDGSLKDSHTYIYEYDSEGRRIPQNRMNRPPEKNAAETEKVENDAHGNWIKKTTFYNNLPVNIFIREIIYYGEPERSLTHPFNASAETDLLKTEKDIEELPEGDAKWLVEAPTSSPDNFSALRYYALCYKEAPSVMTFTGPNIEAIALLHELKDNLHAQEIHSYSTVWNGYERLNRYTLIFRQHPGYVLQATGIGKQDDDEFEVPRSMKTVGDGEVHVSQFQLLRPSDASGKRDEYFEEELREYIEKCSLRKKPEKPVINMIELTQNGFVMREHAVHDDFEIKDLDVNYGYGFGKFHNELMHRFNTSTKGLVLFHGEPGTGKTYYIRHLLRKMVSRNKVVIYMPPNMVDHLVEPAFMTFLLRQVQHWSADGFFCVLLIEDAEPLLAKRIEGVRIQGITNLLNMSDGLLNDMLNLQIICTFNVDIRKLDSALLRPGRLIARKEFKALSELDANLLAQRLGIKHHFTQPATLGEIYALMKNQNTLIHDVEPERDASTPIDDLV